MEEGKAWKKENTACLLTRQKAIASPSGPAEHNILIVEQHKVRAMEAATGDAPVLAIGKGLENQTDLRDASFPFCIDQTLLCVPQTSLCLLSPST